MSLLSQYINCGASSQYGDVFDHQKIHSTLYLLYNYSSRYTAFEPQHERIMS